MRTSPYNVATKKRPVSAKSKVLRISPPRVGVANTDGSKRRLRVADESKESSA